MVTDYLRRYAGPLEDADSAVAILPLGAVETHGPHLPLGTDTLIAEGLLDTALADWNQAPALLRLPALWLGASGEHDQGEGTLALEAEETIAAIQAIGGQLARNGVKRLLLFNAHGGNIAAAQVAALNLRRRHDMLVAAAHWLDFGLPEALKPPTPPVEDVHGGWLETSLLLYLLPDAVRMDRLAASPAKAPGPSLFPDGSIAWGWRTGDLVPETYIGNPELADVQIGRHLAHHVTGGLRRLLSELSQADWPSA